MEHWSSLNQSLVGVGAYGSGGQWIAAVSTCDVE